MILELFNGTDLWEKTEDFQILGSITKKIDFGFQAFRLRFKPNLALVLYKNLTVQLKEYAEGLFFETFRGFVASFKSDGTDGTVELECKSYIHLCDRISVNNLENVATPRPVVEDFNLSNFALNLAGYDEGAYDTGTITMYASTPSQTFREALNAYRDTTGRHFWFDPIRETTATNRAYLRAVGFELSAANKIVVPASEIIEVNTDSYNSNDFDVSSDGLRNYVDYDISANASQNASSAGTYLLRTFTASKTYQLCGVSFVVDDDSVFTLELREGSGTTGRILHSQAVDIAVDGNYEKLVLASKTIRTIMLSKFLVIKENATYSLTATVSAAQVPVFLPDGKTGNIYNLEGGASFADEVLTEDELNHQKTDTDSYSVKVARNISNLSIPLCSLLEFQGADIPVRNLTEIQYNIAEETITFKVGGTQQTVGQIIQKL
jgi:hypothetical protein